jgi:glutathione S-transferase
MRTPKLTLYEFQACPYCALVRRRLKALGLPYTSVEVPVARHLRRAVYEVSGQWLVPTLVVEDGQERTVLTDEEDILRYLDERFAPAEGRIADTREGTPWPRG